MKLLVTQRKQGLAMVVQGKQRVAAPLVMATMSEQRAQLGLPLFARTPPELDLPARKHLVPLLDLPASRTRQ